MSGIAYGVGVGPGDPELMTLKAIRLIRQADVIAVPGTAARDAAAYKIAAAVVPELADKELLAVPMPMTRDRALLAAAHRDGAKRLEQILDQGRDVAFLTLGDPAIYSTFSYLMRILKADGYPVELAAGVASFCAAAARLGVPLTEWDEALHILPAVHRTDDALDLPGTYVLMKSAGRLAGVTNSRAWAKALLRRSGRDVCAVENCGMDAERVFRSVEDIPDDAGYFSLIVARERMM